MNKLLIAITSVLSMTGIASLFVPQLSMVYIAASSILLAAVAVGGLRQLNDQEGIDRNDILKEYIVQYKEKIAQLEERLIGQEKTIIQHASPPRQQPEPEKYW